MKELISSLTVILLIISAQSCRGEDITDEPFYPETKTKTRSTLHSKKIDSITILKSTEQDPSLDNGENELNFLQKSGQISLAPMLRF